jgi:hypothetical protein
MPPVPLSSTSSEAGLPLGGLILRIYLIIYYLQSISPFRRGGGGQTGEHGDKTNRKSILFHPPRINLQCLFQYQHCILKIVNLEDISNPYFILS